jgi:hypothetical protein
MARMMLEGIKMINYKYDILEDAVIKLHDLARIVEHELGAGELSQDIRDSADRLSEVIHEVL